MTEDQSTMSVDLHKAGNQILTLGIDVIGTIVADGSDDAVFYGDRAGHELTVDKNPCVSNNHSLYLLQLRQGSGSSRLAYTAGLFVGQSGDQLTRILGIFFAQ